MTLTFSIRAEAQKGINNCQYCLSSRVQPCKQREGEVWGGKNMRFFLAPDSWDEAGIKPLCWSWPLTKLAHIVLGCSFFFSSHVFSMVVLLYSRWSRSLRTQWRLFREYLSSHKICLSSPLLIRLFTSCGLLGFDWLVYAIGECWERRGAVFVYVT